MNTIVFYGHAASNFGDLAINYGISKQLAREKKADDILYIVVLNLNNFEYVSGLIDSFSDVKCIKRVIFYNTSLNAFTPKAGLHDVSLIVGDKIDRILLNSGEFFYSYTPFTNFDVLINRLFPFLIAAKFKIPLKFTPSTFGPFHDSISSLLIKTLADGYPLVARDFESLNYLTSRNIPCKLGLDPAFDIDKHDALEDRDLSVAVIPRLDYWGIRQDQEKVRNTHKLFKQDNFKGCISYDAYYKVIKRLLDKNIKVTIIVQTLADKPLCYALESAFTDTNLAIEYPKSYDQFLEKFNHASHVVTSRFHSAIFSIVYRVPVFSIHFSTHGHKIPGLYKQCRLPSRFLVSDPSNEFNPSDNLDAFIEQSSDEFYSNLNLEFKQSEYFIPNVDFAKLDSIIDIMGLISRQSLGMEDSLYLSDLFSYVISEHAKGVKYLVFQECYLNEIACLIVNILGANLTDDKKIAIFFNDCIGLDNQFSLDLLSRNKEECRFIVNAGHVNQLTAALNDVQKGNVLLKSHSFSSNLLLIELV